MKTLKLLPFLISAFLCGCVSTLQTPQQQLAERLDFENSTSFRLFSPPEVRFMAEQYFAEAEFLAAQQKNRQLLLELTSLGAILYHTSGMNDLLAAGISSRPLSLQQGAPLYFNRFSAIAAPGTQGYLWHLTAAPPQEIRPFADSLPENTLFAGFVELTPTALMTALKKYADTTPQELEELCQKKFKKSADQLLQSFAGRWEILLFAADRKILCKISIPDPDGHLAFGARIALPVLKQFLPPYVAAPYISSEKGRLIIASQNADELLCKTPRLLKTSPDLDYLLKHLPQQGNGFFYCSKNFSKFFLPPLIVQREKCKLPFSVGVLLASGSAYDVQSLSNCTPEEQELFAALLLPLQRGMQYLQSERREDHRKNRAAQLQNIANRQCAVRMNVIGKKLRQYAAAHQGKFPENLTELDLPGNALICPAVRYSPYVYFAGFTVKSNPRLPLLCDFLPHGQQANVLLLNGQLLTLDLGGTNSLKRIVSILHSRFKYTEKELQMLLNKISVLDKTTEQ